MDSYINPNSIIAMIFLLFFLIISSNSAFPIAKPGCEDHCGNVSIPFPFGTTEGCYLNRGFFIRCKHSSDGVTPPKLYLGTGNVDVRDISLEGQFRVFYGVGYDCYYESNHTRSGYFPKWMNLGSRFPISFNSTANKFVAIGCDTYAVVEGLSDGRQYFTGCMSFCSDREDVKDDACSGIGCCQTSIPNGASQVNTSLNSYSNHSHVSEFNPCSYSFVIEEAKFKFFADNLTNIDMDSSFPVVVDWVVATGVSCEEAKKDQTSYVCKTENSVCYDQEGAIGYRCRCEEGYEGNPYLPVDGCQDIDECANSTLNDCASNSSCTNNAGSYTCNCNQGYHGDGRKGGKGCIADQPPTKKTYWPIFTAAGVSTGSVMVLVFAFCLHSRMMRRKADRLREEHFRKNGGFLLQQKLTGQGGGTYTTRVFTVEELQKATNDFDESEIIGEGGFGTVYKGELADMTVVAIKRAKGVDHNQVEQFINEVMLLSQINSRNVVKLLGCCLETEVPLLVYEFINNGTLFEHIHNKTKASKLSWNIRLRIASEIAGVLSYLHSVASPPIIHRDIKSANILLDQNYTAKVADFGISRLVPMDEHQVSTMVQGTHGYLDPEYLQTGLLTEKSDVYSFGVVLGELLTGRKVLEPNRSEAERFLANYFLYCLKEDRLVDVLDHNILSNESIEQIKEVAVIAKKCISVKGDDRPSMKHVAMELERLGIKAQRFLGQALEICSTESEALLDKKSKAYFSSEFSTSSDLYPMSNTTVEQILFPISGGGR